MELEVEGQMIGTLDFVNVLDRSELLGNMIIKSAEMEVYKKARKELDEDNEAQKLIKAFTDIKNDYEDVQRFGRYHPDYNEIMRNVRMRKREMDMNEKVAQFKIAERNLQKLLDEISQTIAHSVSNQIKVPIDGAALTDGGCGHGGACGCKAS